MSDTELLARYVRHRTDEAFAEIVRRHLDLVHSAAIRQVRSPQLAEEVAQSAFLKLARHAPKLAPDTLLTAWLYQVTRREAIDVVRREARRQLREQIATEMSAMNAAPDDLSRQNPREADWPHIEPLLDEAMHALDESDRVAVLLRYFENKSLREVGTALGTTDEAARKRVSRAVECLREFFAKRGVTVGASGLTVVLAAHAVQAAPIGLGAAITTSSSIGGAVLTVNWLNAKVVAGMITLAAIAGTVVLLFHDGVPTPSAQAAAAPAGTSPALPIKFANNAFAGRTDDSYFSGVDPQVKRTNGSAPAGLIKSLIGPAGPDSPDYLRLQSSRLATFEVVANSPLFGKRIRLTGWLKTKEVDNWAGFQLLIRNPAGRIIAVDEMMDRPTRGTTEWQQHEIVADVPSEICSINFGPMLYGTGQFWADDFQIDVVSTNTPITDDRRWHRWSPNSPDYSVRPDPENPHDGHPTLCLAYAPDGAAPRGSWMWWGQCIREPGKFSGHRVRMTVWTKSEGVSGRAGPNLRPKGPNFELLSQDSQAKRRPITGTTPWTERSVTCWIPKDTQCLDTGFAFNGKGRLWIDMESLRYEIVDDEDAPQRIQ
jgi:RNA polymerase sigma factor (sigma-70 family)